MEWIGSIYLRWVPALGVPRAGTPPVNLFHWIYTSDRDEPASRRLLIVKARKKKSHLRDTAYATPNVTETTSHDPSNRTGSSDGGRIDSMATAASEARRPPPSTCKKTRREKFWEPAVTERWSRVFPSYFGRSMGILSLPFHYLPVIPLLLTIPLSPCKLTQRLWTLAAFSLIGSLRLKLSSDKTKALDSYAAPS